MNLTRDPELCRREGKLVVEPNPSAADYERLLTSAVVNPFHTAAYLEARRRLGGQPWIVSWPDDSGARQACPAICEAGRWRRSLTFDSMPDRPSAAFWQGIMGLKRQHRITECTLGTFGSQLEQIPCLAGNVTRRSRSEWLLDLGGRDVFSGLSSNHRRNIKAATGARLEMLCASDNMAASRHARLVAVALQRRTDSGAAVGHVPGLDLFEAFARHGAAQFMQIVDGMEALASVCLLRAERAAYYHSAGAADKARELGASHFLILQAALRMQAEGIEIFNLGGAGDDNSGLQRFKAGFGARRQNSEAANCSWEPWWRQTARHFASRVVRLGTDLLRGSRGRHPRPTPPVAGAGQDG